MLFPHFLSKYFEVALEAGRGPCFHIEVSLPLAVGHGVGGGHYVRGFGDAAEEGLAREHVATIHLCGG